MRDKENPVHRALAGILEPLQGRTPGDADRLELEQKVRALAEDLDRFARNLPSGRLQS